MAGSEIVSWDKVKEARKRLSRETGTIVKDWGGKLPIAIIYPNSYNIGMSNLGIQTIYRLLNDYPGIVCERAFWEKEDKTALSLESQRPLSDFAVLAFSVTYELDYFNIVSILKSAGIPLYARDRDESHPLVIAGGPCIMANPMPLAPFFDCLCIGEAEPILPALLPVLTEGLNGKREELLKALASLPGLYVPQSHDGTPVVRQWAKHLDDFPVHSVILTPDTELGDLYLIEIERGCQWGCRFCLAGHTFRPVRFRSVDSLLAQAEEGLKYRLRLGLVGAVVPDYPHFEELLSRLKPMGAELSVSSLRIKPLPTTLLKEMAKGGAGTIVLAPEAGSERLRQVIKKGINEDDILVAINRVAGEGLKQLKLYFMIGLPTETDEDIEEMVKLTLKCKAILDSKQTGCRLTLSVAPFVPKAGTPFQWLPMAELTTLNRRLSLLKNSLSSKGIRVKWESPAWSEVQAVLARGDAKMAEVLANMEGLSLAGWRQSMKEYHLDIDYSAHQRWDVSQQLPWAILDSGIAPGHLKLELERSLV
ncbi:MAG: radical domain protein [Dehalococcoidales bacterium]|nr:radical domain protein [Dehalococcoidales bacterium]